MAGKPDSQKGNAKIKERKNEFDFQSPMHDYSNSFAVQAGTDYGVGYTQPIGTERVSSEGVPMGCSNKYIDPKTPSKLPYE